MVAAIKSEWWPGSDWNRWPPSSESALHQAILTSFELSDRAYGINQLRYDLRKLKGHGLIIKPGRSQQPASEFFGGRADVSPSFIRDAILVDHSVA